MPDDTTLDLRVSPADMLEKPNDPGHPSVRALSYGSMEVRWFRPQADVQHEPHDRDELYFVIAGTAVFRRGNHSGPFDELLDGLEGHVAVPISAGDMLFVPAGAHHDFEDTSSDFAVWAVFYGPEGGEQP